MTRVDLEYQNMVHTRRPPAICVNAQQEDVQDHNEHPSIHSQGWFPGSCVLGEESWATNIK